MEGVGVEPGEAIGTALAEGATDPEEAGSGGFGGADLREGAGLEAAAVAVVLLPFDWPDLLRRIV